MAKRVDPLKAKAAKQKKIAIGLVVLLVEVLVIDSRRTTSRRLKPAMPSTDAWPMPAPPRPNRTRTASGPCSSCHSSLVPRCRN